MARAKPKKRKERRGWGAVRELPSGRFQASYQGPDLVRHKSARTFDAESYAEGWLADERKMIDLGTWTPPASREAAAKVKVQTLQDYAKPALKRRTNRHGEPLRPRTLDLYGKLLDRLILPTFGETPMAEVTREEVSTWYEALPAEHATQRAHAYALLRSLFAQAIDERKPGVDENPCRIKGAGRTERKSRVTTATPKEFDLLAAGMPDRLQLLVLLAGWLGLRFGEVAELRRGDIDVKKREVTVSRALTRLNGVDAVGPTKNTAGDRVVTIPKHIVPAIEAHMAQHVGKRRDALLFPNPPGSDTHWTHGHIYKHWIVARDAAGRSDLRLHDLRHSAAVLAALTGATIAELKARIGHSTNEAAMRYQSVASGRAQEIADRLSALAEAESGDTPAG